MAIDQSSDSSSTPPAPKQPWYKNPFVIAFLLGAVLLTVQPLFGKKFLKAPPPMRAIPAWSLTGLADAGVVSSATLAGHPVLVEFAPAPCDAACVERQMYFGKGLGHTDDLHDAIQLLTVVLPGAEEPLNSFVISGSRWHLATGSNAQLAVLLDALNDGWSQWAHTDAGSTMLDFANLPAVMLLDQQGSLRGFWHDDPTGRGNAINAARLLAAHPEVDTAR